MKVLTVCYEYPPLGGGGAPACEGVCQALVAAGHRVDVVTSAAAGLPEREERNGVTIHRTPCRRAHQHFTTTPELLTGLRPALRKAVELHRQNHYDINHTHFAVPSGFVSWRMHRITGLPYLITAHGSDIPGYNPDRFDLAHRLIRPIWRRIIRRAGYIVTPSRFLEGLLQQIIEVPTRVIPYGFDAPPLNGADRRDRILCVSRIFERKGLQYLIRAYAKLNTDWELVIAGDGPYLPELRKLAKQLKTNVTFLGHVQRDTLPMLYQSAKVFAFTSARDNFPVVLLEALAAGCAIVTATGSGCPEVVGDAAVLVPPESEDALAKALQRLIADPAEVTRLSQAAISRVQRFAWDKIAREHLDLYQHMLDGVASP